MADESDQSGAQQDAVLIAGTPEAEAFATALLAQVSEAEARIAEEFLSLEEAEAFALKKGINALTAQIRKENGSDRLFTSEPQPTRKKSKKKRVRVAI